MGTPKATPRATISQAISKIADAARSVFERYSTQRKVQDQVWEVSPAPASRPIFNRWGGIGYGKGYTRFLKDAREAVELLADRSKWPRFTDGPILVVAEFVVEPPKTGGLDFPVGDTDNFAKGPLDVMTKSERYWTDDKQIVGISAFKRYLLGKELPHVRLTWMPMITPTV